tara:strand:- start:655 stop:1242 length:588 start_codon:yes stop_codon:yes gene_type:complete
MPNPANGTDGTIGAAFTWPNFNGESFVSIGNPTKLQFAGAFTICTWSNQDTDIPRQGNERIVSRDAAGGGSRPFLISQNEINGLVQAFAYTSVLKNVQAAGAYNTDTFHFICLVNEGAGGDLLIYVDGELQGTNAGAGGAVANWLTINTEFGRHQIAGDTTDYFTGVIDTGRFYGRALSPDEILRDYYAGLPAHS